MSHNAKDASGNPEVPFSRVEKSSHAADAINTSDNRTTDTKVDRGVQCWSVTEYKTQNADALGARWFIAMFPNEFCSFMFDHRNVWGETDIGAWNRRRMLL